MAEPMSSRDPIHPWRNRRPSRRWLLALLATLLAVVGHVAFLGLLVLLAHVHVGMPEARKTTARPVSLRSLSADQWAKNRGTVKNPLADSASESRAKPAPEKPPEKKKETLPKGQVVDVAPGNDQEAPDAKYLAEHNNAVKKETRAREQTPFYRNAMPQRTTTTPHEGTGTDHVDAPQIAGNNGLGNDDRPQHDVGKKQQPSFQIPDQKHHNEVALKDDKSPGPGAEVSNHPEMPEVRGNSNHLKILPGEAGGEQEGSAGRQGTPGVANLMPSASVLDKITGAAPNDHLSDVDEGEGTFLNTKEWKFASFFNRVKQSVGMHWDPGSQLRQRDPTGNIYGGKDRYTILNVTLNERGMVKDIYVEKSCGLDFLDLEAIKSFERAQPFPNPPPGLLDGDHAIRFSFGFFLEMGSSPRLRLFRQGG